MSKRKKFLVVGDIMLDEFIYGSVKRISPEAPVPILKYSHTNVYLGGAANVALSLKVLGCNVHLCGVVGKDPKGRQLLKLIRQAGIDGSGIVQSYNYETIIKTRFVTKDHHMLRVDNEPILALHPLASGKLISNLRDVRKKVDGIIISDYDKGVVTEDTVDSITLHTTPRQKVFVDPKGNCFDKYDGVTAITPNLEELRMAYPMSGKRWDKHIAAEQIRKQLDLEALLLTQGVDGMILCERGMEPFKIEAEKRKVRDVSGSGDIVVATFAAMVMRGVDYKTAANIANEEAGKAVGRQGTSCVNMC